MTSSEDTVWQGRTHGQKPKACFFPSVRCTKEDKDWLDDEANRRGMTRAAIILHAVRGKTPSPASKRPTLDQKLGAKILADGGRIGGLLNQIAKSVNYNNEVNFQDTLEVWKLIKAYRNDLKKLIEGG